MSPQTNKNQGAERAKPKQAAAASAKPGKINAAALAISQKVEAPSVPAGTDLTPVASPEPEVVFDIRLTDIQPDPWQGRRVLPRDLRDAFRSGDIDAEQAMRAWLDRARAEQSLEAKYIQPFLDLADNLKDGQVNPISLVELPMGAAHLYRLESGERRFWSTWIRVIRGQHPDATIKAIVRPQMSLARQIGENAQQDSLTAVGLAITVARAYLAELGIEPDADAAAPADNDFFRRALLPIDQLKPGLGKAPTGMWDRIQQLMRRKRPHLLRLMDLLAFEDAALDVADRAGLTEWTLRAILEGTEDSVLRHRLVDAAARFQLNSVDIRRLLEDPATIDAQLEEIAAARREGGENDEIDPGSKPKTAKALERPVPERARRQMAGFTSLVDRLAKTGKHNRKQAARLLVKETVSGLTKEQALTALEVYEVLVVELKRRAGSR